MEGVSCCASTLGPNTRLLGTLVVPGTKRRPSAVPKWPGMQIRERRRRGDDGGELEAAARDESRKARISAQALPLRVVGQVREMDVAGGQGALQRLERRVRLGQAGVHEGGRARGDVACGREPLERAQHLARLVAAASCGEQV